MWIRAVLSKKNVNQITRLIAIGRVEFFSVR